MTETLTNTQIGAEPEPSERAASWLQALASRGVTVTVRNNRLWLHPASAHRALSDDEIITLRHHRAAIKALVREGKTYAATTYEPAPAVEKPTPAPEPPCAYCYQSPTACAKLREERPDVFFALHPLEAQEREDARVNKEFRLAFGMDPWPRARTEQPAQTEEQQRQAALRPKLGWDSGTVKI